MHWGAMLMSCLLAMTGAARAADGSPTFGGESQVPFQVAVNPATGQPVLIQAPPGESAQQAAK